MISTKIMGLDSTEIELVNHIEYMMEHWDELPPRIAGKIEGIITAVHDMIPEESYAADA